MKRNIRIAVILVGVCMSVLAACGKDGKSQTEAAVVSDAGSTEKQTTKKPAKKYSKEDYVGTYACIGGEKIEIVDGKLPKGGLEILTLNGDGSVHYFDPGVRIMEEASGSQRLSGSHLEYDPQNTGEWSLSEGVIAVKGLNTYYPGDIYGADMPTPDSPMDFYFLAAADQNKTYGKVSVFDRTFFRISEEIYDVRGFIGYLEDLVKEVNAGVGDANQEILDSFGFESEGTNEEAAESFVLQDALQFLTSFQNNLLREVYEGLQYAVEDGHYDKVWLNTIQDFAMSMKEESDAIRALLDEIDVSTLSASDLEKYNEAVEEMSQYDYDAFAAWASELDIDGISAADYDEITEMLEKTIEQLSPLFAEN